MKTKSSFAEGQLKSLIERIERLEEERKTIAADIKEVYAEAKANGFAPAIMRKVVSLRRKEPEERAEEEAMLDVYLAALGMQPSLFEEESPEKVVPVDHVNSSNSNGMSSKAPPKEAKSSTDYNPTETTPAVPPMQDPAESGVAAPSPSLSVSQSDDMGELPKFLRRKPTAAECLGAG